MEIRGLSDSDKSKLDRLAEYYGRRFMGRGGVIGIHGISDYEVMDYLQNKLGQYLNRCGFTEIEFAQNRAGDHSIDLSSWYNYIFATTIE